VIVTNQAAINRRLLSYEAAESINRRLGLSQCPWRADRSRCLVSTSAR
jgi:hypothetical protein